MKLDKILSADILTGVVFGLLIGVYFPMDAHKEILSILTVLGFIMGLKVVGLLK